MNARHTLALSLSLALLVAGCAADSGPVADPMLGTAVVALMTDPGPADTIYVGIAPLKGGKVGPDIVTLTLGAAGSLARTLQLVAGDYLVHGRALQSGVEIGSGQVVGTITPANTPKNPAPFKLPILLAPKLAQHGTADLTIVPVRPIDLNAAMASTFSPVPGDTVEYTIYFDSLDSLATLTAAWVAEGDVSLGEPKTECGSQPGVPTSCVSTVTATYAAQDTASLPKPALVTCYAADQTGYGARADFATDFAALDGEPVGETTVAVVEGIMTAIRVFKYAGNRGIDFDYTSGDPSNAELEVWIERTDTTVTISIDLDNDGDLNGKGDFKQTYTGTLAPIEVKGDSVTLIVDEPGNPPTKTTLVLTAIRNGTGGLKGIRLQ